MTITERPAHPVARKSRAVLRVIEPGGYVDCAHCDQRIKFVARLRLQQVIANVYLRRRWDRVEHFHDECYYEAGEPYGPASGDHRTHLRSPGTLDMKLRPLDTTPVAKPTAKKRKNQLKG